MKLLIDTRTFIWLVGVSRQVSARAREAIADPRNDLYLSAVSAWEIGRRHAIWGLELDGRPEDLIPAYRTRIGIESLPLTELEATTAEKLPLHHRDPSDRMIIAQALSNGMAIVTSDEAFGAYPLRVLL